MHIGLYTSLHLYSCQYKLTQVIFNLVTSIRNVSLLVSYLEFLPHILSLLVSPLAYLQPSSATSFLRSTVFNSSLLSQSHRMSSLFCVFSPRPHPSSDISILVLGTYSCVCYVVSQCKSNSRAITYVRICPSHYTHI